MGVDLAAKKRSSLTEKSMRLRATLFCFSQDTKVSFLILLCANTRCLSLLQYKHWHSPIGMASKFFQVCFNTTVHCVHRYARRCFAGVHVGIFNGVHAVITHVCNYSCVVKNCVIPAITAEIHNFCLSKLKYEQT